MNLGTIYYNKGVDLLSKANKLKDDEKYRKMKSKADKYFLKAIPYLEKAHELKPDERQVASTLKSLYYRFRKENEEYVDKYKQMQQKLEKMKEN